MRSESARQYLARFDEGCARLAPVERIEAIEFARGHLEKIEQRLARWAANGAAHPQTVFGAFDLAWLDGEMSIRLARARDEGKQAA